MEMCSLFTSQWVTIEKPLGTRKGIANCKRNWLSGIDGSVGDG